MAFETLIVELKGENAQLKQSLSESEKRVQSLANTVDKQSTMMAGSFNRASGGLTAMVKTLAAPIAAVSLGGLITESINLAAQAEQTQVAFSTMLGSAAEAKFLIKDLKKFAADTPFQIAGINEATKKLLAFGFAQEQIIPQLTMLGDIAAGLGIPLQELADIYGRMKTQQTLYAEDLNQLTGRGIPVIQQFAKQFGVAESEVKKLASEGQIHFSNLEQALRDLTKEGSQFGGLMEEQSKTLAGKWSTMKDQMAEAMMELGVTLIETFDFKAILDNIIDFTKGAKDEIQAWVIAIEELGIRAKHGLLGYAEAEKEIAASRAMRDKMRDLEFLSDRVHASMAKTKKVLDDVANTQIAPEVEIPDEEFLIDLSGVDLSQVNRGTGDLKERLAKNREIVAAHEEEWKKQAESLAAEQKKLEETLAARANSVLESIKTPEQRFDAELKGLEEIKHLIGDKNFKTAVDKLYEQFEDPVVLDMRVEGREAVAAGSAEAMARMEEFRAMANQTLPVKVPEVGGIAEQSVTPQITAQQKLQAMLSAKDTGTNPFKRSPEEQTKLLEQIVKNTGKLTKKDEVVLNPANFQGS